MDGGQTDSMQRQQKLNANSCYLVICLSQFCQRLPPIKHSSNRALLSLASTEIDICIFEAHTNSDGRIQNAFSPIRSDKRVRS